MSYPRDIGEDWPFDEPSNADLLEIELAGLYVDPCLVCGSTTACGYDTEGLALIHADGGIE